MNDLSQYFFLDHRGMQRLRRIPQPSSTARLESWANALSNAYFDRRRMDRRDECLGDCNADGEPIVWSDVNSQKLRAKITHMAEREEARGRRETDVFSAVENAFKQSSANQRACLRICILDSAFDGDLTPEEAEKWALNFGLSQIGKRDCLEHCAPAQEAEWSLLMAAVWIQWRDLRYVARLSPESREFFPSWVKIEHEDGSSGYGLNPDDDLEESKPELLRFLRSGASQVTGFREGERRQISPAEWADLRIVGRYGSEGFATVMYPAGQRDRFERVRLSRDALFAAFQARAEPPAAVDANGPETMSPSRKRGPRRVVAPRVEAKMRADLRAGYNLAGATEEELRAKYVASRDTCRRARTEVLSKNSYKN
jgi:hypothetical protein